MIILWRRDNTPFVALYDEKHDIKQAAMQLVKWNMEMMGVIGEHVYEYASTQDEEIVSHELLMERVPDYYAAMSTKARPTMKRKIIEAF